MILIIVLALVAWRLFCSAAESYFERDWPRRTWRGLVTACFLLMLCASAFGQLARIDIPIQTSGPNVPSGAGPLPQALWVANSTVNICVHPSATLAYCQAHPVQTYTDGTGGTTCPSSTQLTQLPSTTCTQYSGVTANVGAWYTGGAVDYWVTSSYGSFGPYTFNPPSLSSGSAGTPQSQCNVITQGAVGDCSTDDHNAIQACLNTQLTSTPQVTVYFPAPPGGCYLTSTLTYTGASLQGQAGTGYVGVVGIGGTVLKGKPGQDVLHIQDPNTVGAVEPRSGWSIRDMIIQVDDTVDASASFPHRKPGRTVQDGVCTASSAVISSVNAEFTAGDVGQNILAKGCGVSGADLSTTIASVTPAWLNGPVTVTMTAAASTTQASGATFYITPANIPVTSTLGNCGLAADNYDGNSANWHSTGGTFSPVMWNVFFVATGGERNNSCGIYFAGTWAPYMMDAKNVWTYGTEWGIIQGLVDTNPSLGVAGQDYQKWDHGWLENTYPWISYNGGLNHLEDIQLTASNGPQFLQVIGSNEGAPNSLYIHIPEFELATGVGYRFEGYQAYVVSTELCDGKTATVDTQNTRFVQSNCGGTLALNGSNNWLDGAGIPQPNIVNKGMDNHYHGTQGQGSSGIWHTIPQAQTIERGDQPRGVLTPDFIRNGTLPYRSDRELWKWPQDFTNINGVLYSVVADSNSLTGNYVAIPNSGPLDLYYFNDEFMLGKGVSGCTPNTNGNCNQMYAGTDFPAGPVLVEFSYKCPSITTFNATIKAFGTGTAVSSVTATSCSTSYATQTISADFTSYTGQAFDLNLSAGEVDIAWMDMLPIGSPTYTDVNTSTLEVTGALTAKTASLQAAGGFPSISGCATITSQTGGSVAGLFITSGTSCTPVLSGLPASVHGKICLMSDQTHPFTASVVMNASSTSTTATFPSFTTTASDVIAFSCPMNY